MIRFEELWLESKDYVSLFAKTYPVQTGAHQEPGNL